MDCKFQQFMLLFLLPWSPVVKSSDSAHENADSRDWAPITQYRTDRMINDHGKSRNDHISHDHHRNQEMYGQYAAYNFGGFGVFRIMQTKEDETSRKSSRHRTKYDNEYEKRLKHDPLLEEKPLVMGDILRFNITKNERIVPISRTEITEDLSDNNPQQQSNKAVYDADDYEKQNDVDVIDWD